MPVPVVDVLKVVQVEKEYGAGIVLVARAPIVEAGYKDVASAYVRYVRKAFEKLA